MKSSSACNIDLVVGAYHNEYYYYFDRCDIKRKAKVGSLEAAFLMKRSMLSDVTLRKIWDLADPQNTGFLTRYQFYIALKLISQAQTGSEPSLLSLYNPSPAPNFGITVSTSFSLCTPDWVVTPSFLVETEELFLSISSNGMVDGSTARPLFFKYGLSASILSQIWNLSDVDRDGSLDRRQFTIAMFLIKKSKEGSLPDKIPVDFLAYSSDDTSSFADMFVSLDTDRLGIVKGEQCRDFMVQFGLSNEVLAKIWDECDENAKGALTMPEFIHAMQLVKLALRPEFNMLTYDTKETDVDLRNLQNQYERLAKENDMLCRDLNAFQFKLREKRKMLASLENEAEAALKLLQEREVNKSLTNQSLERLTDRFEKIMKEISESSKSVEELNKELSQTNLQLNQMRASSKEKEEARSRLKAETASAQVELSVLEERIKSKNTQAASFQAQLNDYKQQMYTNERKSKSLENIKTHLDRALEIVSKAPIDYAALNKILRECITLKSKYPDFDEDSCDNDHQKVHVQSTAVTEKEPVSDTNVSLSDTFKSRKEPRSKTPNPFFAHTKDESSLRAKSALDFILKDFDPFA